jgi:hypothetical protein
MVEMRARLAVVAWLLVACGDDPAKPPDARIGTPVADANWGGLVDAGRPWVPDAGINRGSHRLHCHCLFGEVVDDCSPRPCGSDAENQARCDERCMIADQATCIPDDPACTGLPNPGAWRVDCVCPDGMAASYCSDASCEDLGAPGCRDLCGGSELYSCELGGCELPWGNDALKCTCIDGSEVVWCVSGIDCDSITQIDSHCESQCRGVGGFSSAACERSSSECVPVDTPTLMRCVCADSSVAQGCTPVTCGDVMAEQAACADLCVMGGGATMAYCYPDWPACL